MTKCQWCSKDIKQGWNSKRWGSLFCDDKCRTNYHNARKRLKRLQITILDEIAWIKEQVNRDGELAYDAASAIFAIDKFSSVYKMDFSCKSCGQKRMDFPRVFDKCSFCGKQEWQVKIKDEQ